MYWIDCYREVYTRDLFIYKASKVQKSKNRFVRADVLFAELASDFGGELVVGGGPFREPPTVMQSTVNQLEVRHLKQFASLQILNIVHSMSTFILRMSTRNKQLEPDVN